MAEDLWHYSMNSRTEPLVRADWANAMLLLVVLAIFLGFEAADQLGGGLAVKWVAALVAGGLLFSYYASVITRLSISSQMVEITKPFRRETLKLPQLASARINVGVYGNMAWILFLETNGKRCQGCAI